MSGQHYDFSLIGAGSQQVQASGSYAKLITSSGRVRVRTESGDTYSLLEGQGFRLPDGKEFRDLYVMDQSGAINVGVLFVGDAHFEDSRVSGVVSITNKISAGVTVAEAGPPFLTGLQVTTILSAAANPRGLTVRGAAISVIAGPGGTSDGRLIASPTVPAATVTANSFPITNTSGTAGVNATISTGIINITLPAGWGLYFVTNHQGAAPTQNAYSVTYELL